MGRYKNLYFQIYKTIVYLKSSSSVVNVSLWDNCIFIDIPLFIISSYRSLEYLITLIWITHVRIPSNFAHTTKKNDFFSFLLYKKTFTKSGMGYITFVEYLYAFDVSVNIVWHLNRYYLGKLQENEFENHKKPTTTPRGLGSFPIIISTAAAAAPKMVTLNFCSPKRVAEFPQRARRPPSIFRSFSFHFPLVPPRRPRPPSRPPFPLYLPVNECRRLAELWITN